MRTVETDQVVPTVGDRQRVLALPAEADSDAAVGVRDSSDVVDAVGVLLVRLEEPIGVVDGDRPEPVDGNVVTDGWNYLVRLYRPRPEILDGTWTFPTIAG